MGLYSWGYNHFGQLGLQDGQTSTEDSDDINENNRTTPTQVQFDISQKAWKVAAGWRHTIIITHDKVTYSCGDNEFGQLGRDKSSSTALSSISNLEHEKIIEASCGDCHTLFLNEKGQVFACGKNESGQLGVGSHKPSYSVPLLVEKISIDYEVSAICCGQNHSMAMTFSGKIFSWGDNRHGQLGLGTRSLKEMKPMLIGSLKGCPINHICAGGSYSFGLTISGKLFAWGQNSCGQLGLGDTVENAVFPARVKIPLQQNEYIRYITCGEEHSALLTSGGKVLTFGNGSSGQLGHQNFENQLIPKIVIDLLSSNITSLTCGRKHTMCYSSLNGNLYSFGLNVKGQLGNGSFQKMNSATKVEPCHWKAFAQTDYVNVTSEEKSIYFEPQLREFMDNLNIIESNNGGRSDGYTELFMDIVAGGLSSFLITSPIEKPRLPNYHHLQKKNKLSMLTQSQVEKMSIILKNDSVEHMDYLRIQNYLSRAFSYQSCMNASFLSLKAHETTSKNEHGLHLMGIHVSMKKMWEISICREIIKRCIYNFLLPSLHNNPADIECLRVYVILPEIFVLMDPEEMVSVALSLAESINQLQQAAHNVLVSWWKVFPPTFLERIIKCYKSTILELFPKNRSNGFHQGTVASLEICLKLLKMIFEISIDEDEEKLAYTTFCIPDLMEKIDIRKDFINWVESPDRFSFCHYPFVFEIKEKSLIMEYDADLQMKMMVGRTHIYNLTSLANGSNFHDHFQPQNPFLVLHIRREHLVQDTLNNILAQNMLDFKKPLKIRFAEEDAEDAGGVKKEFFLLLMKDLLDPNYGMFEFFKETGNMWFKPGSFEGPEMFMLIGVICGLAIYNSIIVDMPFPLCLYKKLLDRKVVLEDYRDLDPNVFRNIQEMLDYTEDDFCEIYDMTFQITDTLFGESMVSDLKENGSEIAVTQENKEEYVKCFIEYKFNRSVELQFTAFKDGFLRVCGSKVLHFLHPRELMELVVGSQDYDFADLEKVTEYKGEYYRQHPVIVNFWNVFYNLDLIMKKKFLAFLTGTSKVSVLGIKYMKFIIQPVSGGEDGQHLPVAHTCFNLLDLPRYPDYQTMYLKVHQAIQNSEGFGLV